MMKLFKDSVEKSTTDILGLEFETIHSKTFLQLFRYSHANQSVFKTVTKSKAALNLMKKGLSKTVYVFCSSRL